MYLFYLTCQMPVHSKISATFFLLGLNFLSMTCLIIGILILINFPIAVPGEGGHSAVSEALPTEAVYRGVRGAPEEDQGVPGTPHSH